MDACGDDAPLRVFPVDPADVPAAAVRVVKRTLLRRRGDPDPFDDELARVLVAVVIAALSQPAD